MHVYFDNRLKITSFFLFLYLNFIFLDPVISKEKNNVGNYTIEEQKAIEKFRALVGPELYRGFMRRDEYLIRWIRDQNFDLNNAKEKLLRSLEWRKTNKIDTIHTESFIDLLKLCPFDFGGRDRIGRPVLTFDIGTCPIRRISLQGNHEHLYRALDYTFDRCSSIIIDLQFAGKNVTDAIIIASLNGFTWREHFCVRCWPFIIKLITLYEEHYPYYVNSIIAINSPRVFERALPIIIPLLSERTRKVVRIFGHDKKEWAPAILKLVSPEQIGIRYGGTKQTKY